MGGAPRSTYENEQARLRKQHDGEPADEVRISIPKEPEVNPAVYKDVEAMLFRGFVMLPAEINGVLFVFKSLNHHEFDAINLFGIYGTEAAPPSSFWDMFLAYCVYIVDGANVLMDRDAMIPKLADTFKHLPHKARQKIIRQISDANRRASNAVTLTEAYSMEQTSRFRWAQFKGIDLTSSAVTGIVGTDRLGLNWAQLLWRALNTYEDEHKHTEQDWEHAKFIGSCMAGKGISKIYSQDERRREKEREDRAARKDAVLRHILLGDPLDSKDPKGGVQVNAAHTVEELAAQLEADLRGDQDFHDRVVQAHEERVRQDYQERREQLEQLAAHREREYQGKPLVGGTSLEQGLTPEEVKQRVARRKQLDAQAAASRIAHPELEDPKLASFYEKWGVAGSGSQPPVEQTDRDIANVSAPPPPRQRGTPFRR